MCDSFINTITISTADVTQHPQVKRFFKDNGFRPQAGKADIIYTAKLGQSIIAALRLCRYENSWLLRSMCVSDSHRNKGVGSAMLSSISTDLLAKKCYSFPYRHLQSFYQAVGFSLIDIDQAEPNIANKYNNYLSKGV